MPDQPSTPEYEPEPPRPKTIPDDFIWVPEDQAWYAPGEPSEDFETYWARFLKELDEKYPDDEQADERPHVIASDQLRAAGAHSVSATGPKSRRTKRVDRDQLSLFGDDDALPTKQPPTRSDPNGDELSEDVP